ncbi:MAG: hypothetical protein FJW26_15910 [Acidimicrobiia bacterium]|nr:hypothetical protein [Acidimicrobiia bacterium]
MKAKLLLVAMFAFFGIGAWHFGRLRTLQKHPNPHVLSSRPTFGLLSWNLGYFDYEADSRAQDRDLKAIAAAIAEADARLVALQEIAHPGQLALLSDLLEGRYRYRAFARGFRTDRFVAFLSEDPFEEEVQVATSVGRDALAITVSIPSQGMVRRPK